MCAFLCFFFPFPVPKMQEAKLETEVDNLAKCVRLVVELKNSRVIPISESPKFDLPVLLTELSRLDY